MIKKEVKVFYIIDKELESAKINLDYLLKGYFEIPITKKAPLTANPMKPLNIDIRRKQLKTVFKVYDEIYYAGIDEEEIVQIIKLHNIEKEIEQSRPLIYHGIIGFTDEDIKKMSHIEIVELIIHQKEEINKLRIESILRGKI